MKHSILSEWGFIFETTIVKFLLFKIITTKNYWVDNTLLQYEFFFN